MYRTTNSKQSRIRDISALQKRCSFSCIDSHTICVFIVFSKCYYFWTYVIVVVVFSHSWNNIFQNFLWKFISKIFWLQKFCLSTFCFIKLLYCNGGLCYLWFLASVESPTKNKFSKFFFLTIWGTKTLQKMASVLLLPLPNVQAIVESSNTSAFDLFVHLAASKDWWYLTTWNARVSSVAAAFFAAFLSLQCKKRQAACWLESERFFLHSWIKVFSYVNMTSMRHQDVANRKMIFWYYFYASKIL